MHTWTMLLILIKCDDKYENLVNMPSGITGCIAWNISDSDNANAKCQLVPGKKIKLQSAFIELKCSINLSQVHG